MRMPTETELAEIIQAGDALRQEVEALAYDMRETNPGSPTATILFGMAEAWHEAVSDYREE